MKFLIDNQLPISLASWLRAQGHGAEHVLEIGLGQGKDNPIWNYAEQNSLVIVTKDEDFAEWVRRGRRGPQVLWLRLGNSTKEVLLLWFQPQLQKIVDQLLTGTRLVEVR